MCLHNDFITLWHHLAPLSARSDASEVWWHPCCVYWSVLSVRMTSTLLHFPEKSESAAPVGWQEERRGERECGGYSRELEVSVRTFSFMFSLMFSIYIIYSNSDKIFPHFLNLLIPFLASFYWWQDGAYCDWSKWKLSQRLERLTSDPWGSALNHINNVAEQIKCPPQT